MMGRRLVLMRHAKSDWSHDGLSDHERPLNGRGRRSAPAMAQALAARGFVPDVAASSDSQRTTETWILLAAELGLDVEPRWSRELYLAGPATILAAAARLPAAGTCGLILGHNPGMSEAATLLADLPSICGRPTRPSSSAPTTPGRGRRPAAPGAWWRSCGPATWRPDERPDLLRDFVGVGGRWLLE
ncbi:MAG: histidine phosphatase family protein [bacterium]